MGIQLDCDDPVNNKDLFACKRILLKAKALDYINASIAGGSEFLNDYVLKYSERHETKRRVQSTGRAKAAFDEDGNIANKRSAVASGDDTVAGSDEDNKNSTSRLNLQDICKDLNQEGDERMFVKKTTRESQVQNKGNLIHEDIAKAIKQLWSNDKGIKQCFARSNEFQLEGSAAYYFDNIEKFASPNYVCTDEDILKGRIKTTGITETEFNIGSSKFKVLDAGGTAF